MKKLTLLTILLFLLTGCSGVAESIVDPAGYTQRSTAASNAQRSAAEAQKAFAESQKALADSEAERSRSEAQRAQADAQKAQALAKSETERAQFAAEAQARTAEAQSKAFESAANSIVEAAAQNRNAVIFAIVVMGLLAGWMVHQSSRVAIAASGQQPMHAMLSVPHAVQMIADSTETKPVYDGQRWLLIDSDGNVRQRQRLITG